MGLGQAFVAAVKPFAVAVVAVLVVVVANTFGPRLRGGFVFFVFSETNFRCFEKLVVLASSRPDGLPVIYRVNYYGLFLMIVLSLSCSGTNASQRWTKWTNGGRGRKSCPTSKR